MWCTFVSVVFDVPYQQYLSLTHVELELSTLQYCRHDTLFMKPITNFTNWSLRKVHMQNISAQTSSAVFVCFWYIVAYFLFICNPNMCVIYSWWLTVIFQAAERLSFHVVERPSTGEQWINCCTDLSSIIHYTTILTHYWKCSKLTTFMCWVSRDIQSNKSSWQPFCMNLRLYTAWYQGNVSTIYLTSSATGHLWQVAQIKVSQPWPPIFPDIITY